MFRNNRFGGALAAITILILLGITAIGAFQFGVSQGAGATLLESGAQAGPYMMHPYGFSPFFWGFGLLRFVFTVMLVIIFVRILFGIGMRSTFRRSWAKGRDGDWHEHMRKVHNRLHEEEGTAAPPPPAQNE